MYIKMRQNCILKMTFNKALGTYKIIIIKIFGQAWGWTQCPRISSLAYNETLKCHKKRSLTWCYQNVFFHLNDRYQIYLSLLIYAVYSRACLEAVCYIKRSILHKNINIFYEQQMNNCKVCGMKWRLDI